MNQCIALELLCFIYDVPRLPSALKAIGYLHFLFQLKEKDSIIDDCNTKYSTQKSELGHLQDEISRHNRYLAELPTSEEHLNSLSVVSFGLC